MDSEAGSLATKRLNGKVAVITGGARGIGAARAKLLAENGAHVVIADILDELEASLADSIQGRYIHCNISKESEVESAVQLALTWKGKLDITFNNANLQGNEGGISISNLNMEEMKAFLSVYVHGIKHASRVMMFEE